MAASALDGDRSGEGAARLRLRVDGMDCASCALRIETALARIPGVSGVAVNVTGGTVSVAAPAPVEQVTDAIRRLGFAVADEPDGPAHPPAAEPSHGHGPADRFPAHDDAAERGLPWWRTGKGRLVLIAGALVALAFLANMVIPALGPWPFVAATLIALVPVAGRAMAAARAGSVFTIEMLMTIAALGALAIDAAEEAAVVVFLFAVGELLEGVAAATARRSIAALADLAPKTARVELDGVLREVPAAGLIPGQIVLARPGDRIPCDGRILDGVSGIDESPVNGESTPRTKAPGEEVLAGTVNLEAALRIEVTRSAADNTIARIIRLVEEAQEAKAPVQRFIDRFARVYMPAVVAAALLVALAPPLLFGEPFAVWIYRALALLLIACPCALVISTPAAIAAGLSTGARRGLLIKGGAVLETLGGLKTVAFDKTGTLTAGRPKVTDIEGLAVTTDETLRLAAALETASSHPVARAILAEAADRGLSVPAGATITTISGRGITGEVEGRPLSLVSPRGAAELTVIEDRLAARTAELENDGKTVALLVEGGSVLGLIAVRDEPRPDAAAGLAALAGLGIKGVMLTGDNRRTGEAVARALGITAFTELLPEDKARIVAELRDQGPVGKVGDGINDAPALAAASVGIAMGGGTDVALETADAALLNDRVGGVAELIALSRATLANIRGNVALALGSKAVFLVTTVLGVTGMWIAVLADTGATVLVTVNALRLLRFRFRG